MTTALDTATDTAPEAPEERFANHYAPSAAYDGATTIEAVNAVFKALYAEAQTVHGRFSVPRDIEARLGEDMRRAFMRLSFTRRAPGSSTPRVEIKTANVVEHDDGSLTIVCEGPCGLEQPVKKYPTTKTGARESVCRDCRNKRLEAQRAAKR